MGQRKPHYRIAITLAGLMPAVSVPLEITAAPVNTSSPLDERAIRYGATR